jgi:hypothetical protein
MGIDKQLDLLMAISSSLSFRRTPPLPPLFFPNGRLQVNFSFFEMLTLV